ncbi:hypothetical protein HN789_03515 [archaeon]|jgi:hypothetical protein|nr:hypothetical protein [archaeon]MBT4022667.1 hypothetical protein [archaeon]MBT4272107.1 hypothetical protein [archaeon]MBT4461204.1 hypothetical protein [archaeon]MBT5423648.1 hypothetical protein [archaeon]
MVLSEEDLKKEIERFTKNETQSVKTSEFTQFKDELIPTHFSLYEKACNFTGNLLAIKTDPKKRIDLEESLDTCHLNTTPDGVTSFSILFPIAFILAGIGLSFAISYLLLDGEGLMFFLASFILFGLVLIVPLSTLPNIMANNWRLKASNQMVMSIFYIVSYMRHTSNLELAIKFTSDHISAPLSLDFKKMMWNVESNKYNSMKESIDAYLQKWKKYNPEFSECMHLIESSLYEATEKKRVDALEKALGLILESTYEKMLHFAQNLKSPITMLHMLGVILPILGLVILPLVVSFMAGVYWYHISVLYNVFLPIGVWYLGKVILSNRPTGYGQSDVSDINPELKKFQLVDLKIGKKTISMDPKWIAIAIFVVFFILGTLPITLNMINKWNDDHYDLVFDMDRLEFHYTNDKDVIEFASFRFLGYKENTEGKIIGPYGLGSTLISICVSLGLGLSLAFYYNAKTKRLMNIRNKTRALEGEFAAALFQLGNRVGDGLPPEVAFQKVSEIMENSLSGKFFDLVTTNIATLGMGVEEAIFDKRHGAINKFPSALIRSSMKVFVEGAKKGPDVAAQSLINVSTYIKEMHRVDERLKDLMAEITSSMKSQISFLAPLISGIVIGLTSMITTIINKLSTQLGTFSETSAGGDGGTMAPNSEILNMFSDSIPTFYFQIVVGIYVVQITYILTTMLNTIETGYDPLNEKHMLGLYLKKSGMLYSLVSFVIIMIFNMIANIVINNLAVI